MSSNIDRQMLKQCREYILQEDWESALSKANSILEFHATNYHALVFKGLALLHMKKNVESEKTYIQACKLDPNAPLAWQGLEKSYEMQKNWPKLMQLYEDWADAACAQSHTDVCATALSKWVRIVREHGTPAEIIHALRQFLPTSKYYALLYTLPAPDQSAPFSTPYFEAQMLVHGHSLANSYELLQRCLDHDDKVIESTFEAQKNSIHAVKGGIDALRDHVYVQTMQKSLVPELYEYILSHPYTDNATRRRIQSKQLQLYENLACRIPKRGPYADQDLREEMQGKAKALAHDLVLLRIPNETAWHIELEWSDYALSDLPFETLRTYLSVFPEDAAYVPTIRAILSLVRDPAFLRDSQPAEDLLQLALLGVTKNKPSVLALRIATLLYLQDRDYETALQYLQRTDARLRRLCKSTGCHCKRVSDDLSAQYAVVFAYYQAPTHHKAAIKHAKHALLSATAHQADILLARAYVHGSAGEWEKARDDYAQAKHCPLGPTHVDGRDISALWLNADVHAEAEAGYAQALYELGDLDAAQHAFESLLAQHDEAAHPLGHAFRSRLWHGYGQCLWARGGEYRTLPEHAFRCFFQSIELCPTYAPAFTSLGIFFQEAASPPDMSRACKSLQRAIELDMHEYEAARRLLEHYANEKAWDVVHTIARRVIIAECGVDIVQGSISGLQLTTHPWAWQAAGMMALMQRRAETAVAAFQVWIRAEPTDSDAWISLGEAYVESGRSVAGLKAYARARALHDEQETWYIDFLIADAQRRLGRYELTIKLLEGILEDRPTQVGVRVHLAETMLLQAQHLLSRSYSFRSVVMMHRAIHQAAQCIEHDARLRSAWKVVGDACFALSRIDMPDAHPREHAVQRLIVLLDQLAVDHRMPTVRVVQSALLSQLTNGVLEPTVYVECAVLVFKYMAYLCANDEHGCVLAWADLATSLCRMALMLRASNMSDEPDERAEQARREAIQCTKVAMKLRPMARLWLLLGHLHFAHSPMYAQHAYIKALDINKESPVAWTNLGFLYLSVGDASLAENAFAQAQRIAPMLPTAWFGAALLHKTYTHSPKMYVRLFEQACLLSDCSLLEADYGLAEAVWTSSKWPPCTPVSPILARGPMIALHTYMANRPHDDTALHLCALLAEQLGYTTLMARKMERAFTLVEGKFSETESAQHTLRFGIINMNLGRMRLASLDAQGAMDHLELALALLEDLGDAPPMPSVRVWCHIGVACAQCLMGDYEEGMAGLRAVTQSLALSLLPDDQVPRIHGCVGVLLARFGWHAGLSVSDLAADLDQALSVAPHDPLLITTRAALEAVHGRVMEYNGVLGKYVTALPPHEQLTLRNTPQTAMLSMMHLAASFDLPTVLQHLARTYTRPDNTTTLLVMVAHMHLRLAAGCRQNGTPIPRLPIESAHGEEQTDSGTLLDVARHVQQIVRARAVDEGAEHWATIQWILALAEYLTDASTPSCVPHAAKAVHLAPWDTHTWQALETVSPRA